MKKVLIIPLLFGASALLWYCQKSDLTEQKTIADSATQASEDRSELLCSILPSVADHSCSAQIRVRCISVAPGYDWACFYVQGTWQYLAVDNNVRSFSFNIGGDPVPGGGDFSPNVWYDIVAYPNNLIQPPLDPKKPLLKQYLLDQYCPGNPGNSIRCTVNVGDCFAPSITQWSMLVDIKSGDRTTTYTMNGATGILTPLPPEEVPGAVAEDVSDVDFYPDCTNNGADGHPIVPGGPVFTCEEPNGH